MRATMLLVAGLALWMFQPAEPDGFFIDAEEVTRQRANAAGQLLLAEATRFVKVHEARLEFSVTGAGLAAAVLDTGLRMSHADFNARVPAHANFTTDYNSDRTNVSDRDGHGTNVAGVIGARQEPMPPSSVRGEHEGVAPSAMILPVKVLANDRSGSFQWVAKGLEWVLEQAKSQTPYRIGVVNLSLGDSGNYVTDTTFQGGTLHKLFRELRQHNIAVVAAAGNAYAQTSPAQGMSYPAILRETISVGAVMDTPFPERKYRSGATATHARAGQITPFSQRLDSPLPELSTDIFAPGDIMTSSGILNDRGESSQWGTSQAAPMVSGVILLMQEYHLRRTKSLPTVEKLEEWLRRGSRAEKDDYGSSDSVENTYRTYRRLDALGAMRAMKTDLDAAGGGDK